MAKNQSIRIKPATIQADVESLQAAKALTGYQPANTTFALPNVESAYAAMIAAQETEAQAIAAADTARDMAAAKEWEYHNLILGMKDQVKAQYGSDSTELQSVGLKRKSEYKRRSKKAGK